ncbi:MAG: hypothetical protein GX660_02255 [Clostridiaceae bacterium]|nr:hypothetical protein [Clostridiaceae bacterium]
MNIKEILYALRPLRRRMHFNNALVLFAYALIAAGVFALVLSIFAMFLPVPLLLDKLVAIYGSFVLLSVLVSFFIRPGIMKTIRTGDSLGLKERLITAYYLKEDSSPVASLQRQDALNVTRKADFRLLYPVRLPAYRFLCAFVIMLMVAVTFVIPTGAKDKAVIAGNVLKEMKKQAEKLELEKKELNKSSKVSADKLRELNKKVEELLKELNKSKNAEDAVKALSKAKHELDKLKLSEADLELLKLAEKLAGNQLTKDLGDALKEGNKSNLEEKLQELKENLENASNKDKNELAKELKEASSGMENEDLKESLSDLSETLENGDITPIESNLQALSDALSKTNNSSGSPASGQQAINQISQAISEARHQISKSSGINRMFSPSSSQGSSGGESGAQQGNEGGSADESSQGSGSQANNGSESNAGGQGNSGNSSQGGQSGQGAGQSGQGQGGNGVGDGTSNRDAGYSGPESGGGSRAPGEKKTANYERIYVPDRIGGDSEASQVKGQKGSGGQSQYSEADSVPFESGGSLPYNEVFEEYRDEAMSGLMDAPVPPGMKDIVRDYFSTLE